MQADLATFEGWTWIRRDKVIFRVVVLSLVLHLAAACLSLGFHQFDEHFSVLEFLKYKLDGTPADRLVQDFTQERRPWIGVLALYIWALPFHAMTDSAIWLERWLRVGTSLFGFATSLYILRTIASGIGVPTGRAIAGQTKNNEALSPLALRVAAITLLLGWPFLYTHARVSVEPMASNVYWLGWCVLHSAFRREDRKRLLGGGVLLGLAFHLRYHLGTAYIGLVLAWWLSGSSARHIVTTAMGGLVGLALGFAADAWGYGHFAIAPWNYFYSQIVLREVDLAGVSPWWSYLPEIAVVLIPPFSVVWILPLFWLIKRRVSERQREPLALWLPWATFFLAHCLVRHKELRFLTPMLPLVAWLGAIAVMYVQEHLPHWSKKLRLLFQSYALLNLISIPLMVLRPASFPVVYYQYIDDHFRRNLEVFWIGNLHPMALGGFEVNFYRPASYTPRHTTLVDLAQRTRSDGQSFLLFSDSFAPVDNCRVLTRTIPAWLMTDRVVNAVDPAVRWTLFRCE